MELVSFYKNANRETCNNYNKMELDSDGDINMDQNLCQIEARAQNRSLPAGNKCVVLITVCFGLTCIFLVATIVVLHIKHRAERESQATHMLQSSSRDQTEKDQLQHSFNSLSQKNLELDTKVKDLTTEKSRLEARVNDLISGKSQLQSSFNSLSQKNLELETRVNDLTTEKSQLQSNFSSLNQTKLELEIKVIDLTTEKNNLEARVNDLISGKNQSQSKFSSFSQRQLELETELTKLSEQGFLFMSKVEKSWSDSRQYCRDHGGDLVIINTEEKQRLISSFVKERVWIGLSDIENERNMKWVDNSTLKQGFWADGEPNDDAGIEDCAELRPEKPVLKNWNDLPCSLNRKGICETFHPSNFTVKFCILS